MLGKVGLLLAQSLGESGKSVIPRIKVALMTILPWRVPIADCLPFCEAAVEEALQIGDLEMASYMAYCISNIASVANLPLHMAINVQRRTCNSLIQRRQVIPAYPIHINLRLSLKLACIVDTSSALPYTYLNRQ